MKLRYVALVTGAGALMGGLPSWASTTPGLADDRFVSSPTSPQAQRLLELAAESSRARSWVGVQHVVSVRDGYPTFTVLRLSHQPGTGSQVTVIGGADEAADVTVNQPTDSRMLSLLGQHYDLAVAGVSECTGRRAVVVEARRRGVVGSAAVAGRFWVDSASHLVLRREVLDTAGSVIRSAAFVEMTTGAVLTKSQQADSSQVVRPTGELLSATSLSDLEAEGWPVPRTITSSSLDLFEARLHEGGSTPVLQLSYSDGLSTLSLFVQRGWLDGDPAGTARSLDGGTVWVEQGAPERVVWSGGEFTWTLVSDAASETVTEAVTALPHQLSVIGDDGVPDRVWRGMARVGGWLNPFH